jgi:hypothetical protein
MPTPQPTSVSWCSMLARSVRVDHDLRIAAPLSRLGPARAHTPLCILPPHRPRMRSMSRARPPPRPGAETPRGMCARTRGGRADPVFGGILRRAWTHAHRALSVSYPSARAAPQHEHCDAAHEGAPTSPSAAERGLRRAVCPQAPLHHQSFLGSSAAHAGQSHTLR